MDPQLTKLNGLEVEGSPTGEGVLVSNIFLGSVAAAAGLVCGDIILSLHNIPTNSVSEFCSILKKVPGPLNMTYNRGGNLKTSCMYRATNLKF